MSRLSTRLCLGFVLVGFAAALPAAGQPYWGTQAGPEIPSSYVTRPGSGYEIILIDPPETLPTSTTQAYAVNNAGQVLANYSTASYLFYTGAIWEDGVLTTVDSSASQQADINQFGHAVATRSDLGLYEAIMWRDGEEIDLDIPSYSCALGINDADQVVGQYDDPSGDDQAFLWDDFVLTDLPELNRPESTAIAINNAQQIAGYADYVVDPEHPEDAVSCAVLWEYVGGEWVITPLAPLGTYSFAMAMNEAGDVVGAIRNGSANRQPALFTDSGVTILNEETDWGIARGINQAGHIVGSYEPAGPSYESAFLWKNGTFTDLNDLLPRSARAGWDLWWACDINDNGWIVGIGDYQGEMRGFILRPVSGHATLQWQSAAAF